jgi:hypothetical protein
MTSFAELVDARWRSIAAPEDAAERERYEATRTRFEREHGRIVSGHFAARHAAGVAICCRHLSWGRLQWSVHRSMGGLAVGRPELSPLLLHTEGESARASSILSGMAQRVAVTRLFTLNRNVMTALEA